MKLKLALLFLFCFGQTEGHELTQLLTLIPSFGGTVMSGLQRPISVFSWLMDLKPLVQRSRGGGILREVRFDKDKDEKSS